MNNDVEQKHAKFVTLRTVLIHSNNAFIVTSDDAEFFICEEEICGDDCNSFGVLGYQHEFIGVFLYCLPQR